MPAVSICDSYIKRRALTDYTRLCVRQGYLFREPSRVERDGNIVTLSAGESVLARFGILPSGRLQPVEE